MSHVMLDLETLGTAAGCVVLSLGIVSFDPNSDKLGAGYYANLERESQLARGLVKDPDTVAWWERQSDEAKAALEVNPQPTEAVLGSLTILFNAVPDLHLWSHGASFDAPILASVFRAFGQKEPWNYTRVRDTRTLFHMSDKLWGTSWRGTVEREGTHHNALDDARYQARLVQAAVQIPYARF